MPHTFVHRKLFAENRGAGNLAGSRLLAGSFGERTLADGLNTCLLAISPTPQSKWHWARLPAPNKCRIPIPGEKYPAGVSLASGGLLSPRVSRPSCPTTNRGREKDQGARLLEANHQLSGPASRS